MIYHFYLNSDSSLMYADDTSLKAFGENIAEVESKLQSLTDQTVTWLHNNRLLVNSKKSTTMLISTRQKLACNNKIRVRIRDEMIEQSSNSPLLGLEFDSCLSWKEHVSVVCKKVSRKLCLLKRLKHNLSSALLNAV